MKVSCILCDGQTDTTNDEVIVTVNWVFSDIIKKNNLQFAKALPRVVKICKKCWNSLKVKPKGNDYFWIFNVSL